MKDAKTCLRIISELMDEDLEQQSKVNSAYDDLYKFVHEDLVYILDQGVYNANSEIIRLLDEQLEVYTIFNSIKELIGKRILVLRGAPYYIQKNLFEPFLGRCDWIRSNPNLPMIIVNNKEKKNCIYAVTYMDKVVPLESDDYLCINRELYKHNIEIRKLIKCFLVYADYKYENLNFLIVPNYAEADNEILKKIKTFTDKEYVYADPDGTWKKIYRQIPEKEAIYLGNKEQKEGVFKFLDKPAHYEMVENFEEICHDNNRIQINYGITNNMLNIIIDAEVYYYKTINSTNNNIMQLSKEAIMIEDKAIKQHVVAYKKELLEYKDRLEQGQKLYFQIRNKLIESAKRYETGLSKMLMTDLDKDADSSFYQTGLLMLLFKSISANNFDIAKECVLKLKRSNYPYVHACECYISSNQGQTLTLSDVLSLNSISDNAWEVAKIKVALSGDLKLLYADLKQLVINIGQHIDTGKEFYFLAKRYIDEKKYNDAKTNFENALKLDYYKAGDELVKLAKTHPECQVDIEELAENLVPMANYQIGVENIKNQKGIVNIKMAASNGYMDAIVLIADMLFEKCRWITWQQMEIDENRYRVNNVIRLYEYIEKRSKDTNTESLCILRIGLMYCKLQDYGRAYEYLKGSSDSQAQYECAKMCQYGNGVARDIKKARQHYLKIKGEYKDSAEQLTKINNQLRNQEKKEKIKKTETENGEKTTASVEMYQETKQYKSTTSNYHETSSSFCFITTAACMALNEDKNCAALNRLRWFRDTHLLTSENDNRDLVEEYYRIGPKIVKAIDCDWNPYSIYTELWEDYIYPSYSFINNELWEKAKNIYIAMVKYLCEKYSVSIDLQICRKYKINVVSKNNITDASFAVKMN